MKDTPNSIFRGVSMTHAFLPSSWWRTSSPSLIWQTPSKLILTDAHRQECVPLSQMTWTFQNSTALTMDVLRFLPSICFELLFSLYLWSSLSLRPSPVDPLHSTAAALVKVTEGCSIANPSGHCSANLTQPISSFDLIVDHCLLFERLSSTNL